MASSFLDDYGDDYGEETTAVERVHAHLVAATASREDLLDDALDDAPFSHDDAPTLATPVDVDALLSIVAATGLASPLGDTPAPEAPSWPEPVRPQHPVSLLPPQALRAEYERAPAPTIRVMHGTSPKLRLELTLVALTSFVLTVAAGVSVAWALGAPLLRR